MVAAFCQALHQVVASKRCFRVTSFCLSVLGVFPFQPLLPLCVWSLAPSNYYLPACGLVPSNLSSCPFQPLSVALPFLSCKSSPTEVKLMFFFLSSFVAIIPPSSFSLSDPELQATTLPLDHSVQRRNSTTGGRQPNLFTSFFLPGC